MKYKEASLSEIEEIYITHMKNDFPPAELKPLEAIKYSVSMGWYRMYLAYDEGGVKGYACVADCTEGFGFLDYYAIVKDYRGTGVGTEFFRKLKDMTDFSCIILETESVESSKNQEEEFIRKRRIAFYERSGCVNTGCMYNVFGVEYNVFINNDIELTPDFLAKLLSAYEYAYAAILRRDDKDYIRRIK